MKKSRNKPLTKVLNDVKFKFHCGVSGLKKNVLTKSNIDDNIAMLSPKATLKDANPATLIT